MKNIKKMILGIAFLIIATMGIPLWTLDGVLGAIVVFGGLIVGGFFIIDGYLSVDKD